MSLQIKILDVLYNNRICSLVYMHDISSVIGGNKKSQEQRGSGFEKLSSWGIMLIEEPDKFMHDLTEQIYSVYGGDVGIETENALSDFKSNVDLLSNSMRNNEGGRQPVGF